MKTNEKEYKNPENQDIDTGEYSTQGSEHSAAESTSNDNLTDTGDTASCETPDAPHEGEGDVPRITPEEEAAIWKDKFVRLSAEYDNYRKRTFKEKMDIIAAGGQEIVCSMLDVLDDMDRALDAIAKTDDIEAVKQGITLIDTKLRGALRGKGLAEIEAVGSELDTDLHEAVARIDVEDKALKGKIIDVVRKGYKLKDKIIRYAKVVVGQ